MVIGVPFLAALLAALIAAAPAWALSPAQRMLLLSGGAPSRSGINVINSVEGSFCGSGVTTCSGAPLSVTAGNTLIVISWDSASGNFTTSVSGSGLGSCSLFSGADNTNGFFTGDISIWHCPITSTGLVTATASYSPSTNDFPVIWEAQVSVLSGSPDEGVGNNNGNHTTGTSLTVVSNGSAAAGSLVINGILYTASSWSNGGAGYATLLNDDSSGFAVQSYLAGSAGTTTAASTQGTSGAWGSVMAVMK